MLLNLSLRIRVFLIFAALAVSAAAFIVGGLWFARMRMGAMGVMPAAAGPDPLLSGLVAGGVIALLGTIGATAWVWYLFDQNVVRPIERLSGGLRTGSVPDPTEGRYLADLAPAARDAAEARARAAEALTAEVQRHAADLQLDKAMLETILADVGVGAVMADAAGRVVFYNAEARRLLPDLALGRALSRAVDAAALAEAQHRLDHGPEGQEGAGGAGVALQCRLADGCCLEARLRRVDDALVLVLSPQVGAICALPGLAHDFAMVRLADDHASDPLDRLSCVVFDTETTGLTPQDRIVQIAGFRIHRGRDTGERFDALVNPGRPIPALAASVHGITDAMVADAPPVGPVLREFSRFAAGDVLLAHNAPFDMGLLHAAQGESGVRFDNPVLDTVLLSAMVWGHSADHSLDALAERLGVPIPPEQRHTAMGDAQAAAACFLRLIPALKAKGIVTLNDVRREARKFRGLIEDADPAARKSVQAG